MNGDPAAVRSSASWWGLTRDPALIQRMITSNLVDLSSKRFAASKSATLSNSPPASSTTCEMTDL